MENNIEKLRTEVDEIKNSLNELKDNVSLSEKEKKKQAKELKSKAETAKQKIENEIHSLEDKTDEESMKQKEKAETLLKSLDDITTLYASIISTSEPEAPSEPEPEKKSIFKKAKDWIWDQWSDVWDKQKWKDEKWKNLLRTAWFTLSIVWAGALIFKWLKKLFGKKSRTPDTDVEAEPEETWVKWDEAIEELDETEE